MKIVVLDAFHLNPGDLSWDKIKSLGEVEIYEQTEPTEILRRAKNADVLLTNKVVLDAEIISELPELKCICVMATGYNNVDLQAAKERGIPVCNVKDYSTNSVAQQVFAGILSVLNRVESYASQVRQGIWTSKNDWSYTIETINNLEAMTMGIIGFGQIGQRVAELALSFNMKVIAVHRHPERDKKEGVNFVSLDELFEQSDIITLHVPLNAGTQNLINEDSLCKMKSSAILVNTGRGGLVNETDLYSCLKVRGLRAAILDVMNNEPPSESNPLLELDNCYITPHVAWAGDKSRHRMMEMLYDNIEGFIMGNIINQVN